MLFVSKFLTAAATEIYPILTRAARPLTHRQIVTFPKYARRSCNQCFTLSWRMSKQELDIEVRSPLRGHRDKGYVWRPDLKSLYEVRGVSVLLGRLMGVRDCVHALLGSHELASRLYL